MSRWGWASGCRLLQDQSDVVTRPAGPICLHVPPQEPPPARLRRPPAAHAPESER